MKYIVKNITVFAKNETAIFVLMIVCIFSAAFIMNFTYGLYMNYNTALNEANKELKTIYPLVSDNARLTKGEFQEYIEALDAKIQNAVELIYAEADLTKNGYDDHYSYFPMRFDIKDNKYLTPEKVRDIWVGTKLVTRGEYITAEEEETGAYVALVSGDICDKDIGESIDFLGNTYTVKGVYVAGSFTPLVPFLTVPGDIEVDVCSFTFSEVITRSAYNDLKATADKVIPNKLIFPELQLPDDDTTALYRNIILISILVAGVSVMNFAMLYLFIVRKRKKELVIMRLCGAVKIHITVILLGECLFMAIPAFTLGSLFFDIMLKTVLCDHFPYMSEVFGLSVYLLIAAIYTVVMVIISGAMIVRIINSEIKECLAERTV